MGKFLSKNVTSKLRIDQCIENKNGD